jgi:hypothetical protein
VDGMDHKELLITIFEKEVGVLRGIREVNDGYSSLYELEFDYKGKIDVKIVLIKRNSNHWFIHHDLSYENPFLLKRIAYICERLQRIKENKTTAISLSDDLLEISQETFIKTAVRCTLQNLLNQTVPLFGEAREKTIKIHSQSVKLES